MVALSAMASETLTKYHFIFAYRQVTRMEDGHRPAMPWRNSLVRAG